MLIIIILQGTAGDAGPRGDSGPQGPMVRSRTVQNYQY